MAYLTFTNVLAYPNPTTGMVTLDINISLNREETVKLYVVDILGKILRQGELAGKDYYVEKLDFTGWTPGMYFIHLRTVNQVRTVKIMVADD